MAEFNPGDKCEICLEKGQANKMAEFACLDCDSRMCTTCKTRHTSKAMFRSHRIEPFPRIRMDFTCHKHSKKLAQNWCIQCKKAICNVCLDASHDGHRTKPIQDSLTKLQQKRQTILNTKQQLELNQKNMSETIDLLTTELDDAVHSTEEHRDKVIQIITARTDKLLSDVKDNYQSQINNLTRNLQIEDNKINEINKWIQTTTEQFDSLSSDSFHGIQTLIDDSEHLTKQTSIVSDTPKLYRFVSEKSLNVGEIVRKYHEKPIRGACQVWQGQVKGGRVWDMKFVSRDTLCCVQGNAIHLYINQGDAGSFRLLRETKLDGHQFCCVAATGESRIYLTCGDGCGSGGCGTVHQYDLNKHCLLPHTGRWKNDMLEWPYGIAVNSAGIIAVGDVHHSRHCVYLYRRDGSHVTTLGAAVTSPHTPVFKYPLYLTWDNAGRLVVSDRHRHCLFVLDSGHPTTTTGYPDQSDQLDYKLTTTLGKPDHSGQDDQLLWHPVAVCVDQANNVLVADTDNNRLSQFDCQGKFLFHPLTDQLHPITEPRYVDIVYQGDRGFLLVGDYGGNIKVFTI